MALRFATLKGDFSGTPEQIADRFQPWLETRASDGFVVGQPLHGQFRLFVDEGVPILQKRGSFRDAYDGATFRDSLGIGAPPNRYTVQKTSRAVA